MATYIQSGTGAQLTQQQIAGGNYAPNTFFIESGTGRQLTQQQVAGAPTPSPSYTAPVTTPTPTSTTPTQTSPAPTPQPSGTSIGSYQGVPIYAGTQPSVNAQISAITNPTTPPSNTGSPTLPNAQAPTIADQFNTSLASNLTSTQQQLQQALQTQQQNYQTRIDALTKQSQDFQMLQEAGLASEQSTIQQETQAKQAALEQEQQQFKQNYDARQALTNQLQSLLTTGQQTIEQMKGTTGLASIMNPRISQTMTDVQAQAGVISAALSAYSDQIGLAQNQLKSATEAISSIYSDQINYWQNVISFYNDQQKQTTGETAKLTADQKTYIDAQIQQLQDKVTNTQKNSESIFNAMIDPKTALDYAKAGVTLNDSPEQINQKLGVYEQSQQNVWGAPKLVGHDLLQQNRLTGEYKAVASSAVISPTTTTAASNITIGQDLSDAKAFILAHPDIPANTVMQTFLQTHPGKQADWNGYFTDSSGKLSYPTAPKKSSGIFGLGFFGL